MITTGTAEPEATSQELHQGLPGKPEAQAQTIFHLPLDLQEAG